MPYLVLAANLGQYRRFAKTHPDLQAIYVYSPDTFRRYLGRSIVVIKLPGWENNPYHKFTWEGLYKWLLHPLFKDTITVLEVTNPSP